MKGCYLLLLCLDEGREIEVGKLGRFWFSRGYYCYTGSALGGVEQRLRRHRSRRKRMHWHVDHLAGEARGELAFILPSEDKLECPVNSLVTGLADSQPARGFGSSDCSCYSHLSFFRSNPEKKLAYELSRFSSESNLTLRLERFME